MDLSVVKYSKLVVIIFTGIVLSLSGTALAFNYYINKPLFFTYKSRTGYWRGCGPIQCTSTGHDSEREAISYIINGKYHGPYNWIGDYGKCRVYQGDGELSGGDYSTDWVIGRMNTRCN